MIQHPGVHISTAATYVAHDNISIALLSSPFFVLFLQYMSQNYRAGDFLVYQLESAFALLRLLAIDETDDGRIWHLAGYSEFFPDVESAEAALDSPGSFKKVLPHAALTERAFQSTQTAPLANQPLSYDDLAPLNTWRENSDRSVSNISIRLLLGFR